VSQCCDGVARSPQIGSFVVLHDIVCRMNIEGIYSYTAASVITYVCAYGNVR
jgi:hypothetical protein